MKSEQSLLKMVQNMRPIEFVGLAKLLGVSVIETKDAAADDPRDRYEPRSFADVLEDVIVRFNKLNRQRKREIIKLIKKSNSATGVTDNAGNTEDTSTASDD